MRTPDQIDTDEAAHEFLCPADSIERQPEPGGYDEAAQGEISAWIRKRAGVVESTGREGA